MARVRPGSPASTVWSLRVQMIRSPGLARVPSAMVTAGPPETMPRVMRSSRIRRFSSRRSAWSAAISSVSVPSGGQGDVGGRGGVHHLLRVAADDAAVLVVLGQHAECRRRAAAGWLLFPGVAEPDGFGQPGVAQRSGRAGTCRRRSPPPAAG